MPRKGTKSAALLRSLAPTDPIPIHNQQETVIEPGPTQASTYGWDDEWRPTSSADKRAGKTSKNITHLCEKHSDAIQRGLINDGLMTGAGLRGGLLSVSPPEEQLTEPTQAE